MRRREYYYLIIVIFFITSFSLYFSLKYASPLSSIIQKSFVLQVNKYPFPKTQHESDDLTTFIFRSDKKNIDHSFDGSIKNTPDTYQDYCTFLQYKNAASDRVEKNDNAGQPLVDPRTLINNPKAILLQAGGFTTDGGPVSLPEDLSINESDLMDRPARYLVQFIAPVCEEWKKEITALGCSLEDYIPHNAFIIKMTSLQKEEVDSLSYVQWIGLYQPAFKISKSLLYNNTELIKKAKRINKRQPSSEKGKQGIKEESDSEEEDDNVSPLVDDIPEESETVLLTAQTFESGKLPLLFNIIDSFENVHSLKISETRKSRMIMEVPKAKLNDVLITLAKQQDIEWIEPYIEPTLDNNEMRWVVQSNINDETPLWNKGITGKGQIVGVGDTGLDYDMVFFWDAVQGVPTPAVNLNQRKVISYHDLAGNGDWDSHDHGTHVAGTIAGRSLGTNSEYNGIAYGAKLVIQDIGAGGSLIGLPGDLNTYFQQAYNDGARIHSNSWGSAVNGAYTSYSQDADEFMWNHKDFLICFSAGNSGPGTNTVGSPGTAKNIITSGACETPHASNNQEDVAYFSSNGPTDDGRIKPTVTAPGYYILSADNDFNVTTFNSGIRSMSGTSMSCPSHAGSAALVRQYYIDGFYPTGTKNSDNSFIPSAALIKATMINSAENMTGEYTDSPVPGTGQGWGRILLDNTLFFSGDTTSFWIEDNTQGLQTAESSTHTFISDGVQPLKITLVWTDHYPSLASAVKIVNDLDLTVTGPNGTYKGNVFSAGHSITGGTYDRLNVEEIVFLPNPAAGTYTVTVAGQNIPSGPQPYALVVRGITFGSSAANIHFDKTVYRDDSEAVLTVTDLDMDTTEDIDNVFVHLYSDTDLGGTDIQLNETGPETGIFSASFIIGSIIQVNDKDKLYAEFTDEDNGNGKLVVVSSQAEIDLFVPSIVHRFIFAGGTDMISVNWMTDEDCIGTAYYRKKGTEDWLTKKTVMGINHSALLEDLETGTTYEIKLGAADPAGNETTDDNDGQFYNIKTYIEIPVFFDDTENGSSMFTVSGSNNAGENGMWHITDFKSSSPTHAWYYGMESTKTYDTGSTNHGFLTTSTPINLNGLNNAFLKFRHNLKTEDYSPYDVASVQISEDGVNWTTLYQATKSASAWEEINLDLYSYVGKTIFFRFYFDTKDSFYNNYEGWLIDDIRIMTSFPDDGITPDAPAGVSIDDPGNNSLILSWSANTEIDIKGYNVYRDGIKINQDVVRGTTYADTGLIQGTDCSYEISAVDWTEKESEKSEAVSATSGRPFSPDGVNVAYADNRLEFAWDDNTESDLSGYNIYHFYKEKYSYYETVKEKRFRYTDYALRSRGARVKGSLIYRRNRLINGKSNNSDYAYFKPRKDIIIDLGRRRLVHRVAVNLWSPKTKYWYRYRVYVSADGKSYKQVVNRSKERNRGLQVFDIKPQKIRYIKIRALYASQKWFRIKEVCALRKIAFYRNVAVEKFAYKDVYEKMNSELLTASEFTLFDFANDKAYDFLVTALDSYNNESDHSSYHYDPLVDTDGDGDGILNNWELSYGMDFNDPADAMEDMDNDGLTNLEEFEAGTDPGSVDSDFDGINDLAETLQNLSPVLSDTDGDGLKDGEEVYTYGTDPLKKDSDEDGMDDLIELNYWTQRENMTYHSDKDNDGLINILDFDSDNDGLSDGYEVQDGTDPARFSPLKASPDPEFEYFTYSLPKEASPVRLSLPANIDDFLFNNHGGIGGFGLHAGGHIEGLDHVWIELKPGVPVKSWADGVVKEVKWNEEEYHIFIDYGSSLEGIHMEIMVPYVNEGDIVSQGDLIGLGMSFDPHQSSAEFSLIDRGRTDGPEAWEGGVYVSPFDYLNDTDKRTLVDTYKEKVIEPYVNDGTKVWGFEPYQPYLTNKVYLHKGNYGKLHGSWYILNSPEGIGFPNDILTFIEADNPYFTGNVVMAQDRHLEDWSAPWHLKGTFEVNYETHQVKIIMNEYGPTYFGIFEIDETGDRAVLRIEYQEGTYPESFSENALIYIQRD
ncbi:MAG: S8 family serine peptidase [Candidatus Aureabacteria bacterium]|nr:S8 family serine peptidase [Candidatus Auribacterota bacterium]